MVCKVVSSRSVGAFPRDMRYAGVFLRKVLGTGFPYPFTLLSPAVSSLYAPVATPVASQTSVSASTPLLRMRIPPAQAALEQYAAVDAPASTPSMVCVSPFVLIVSLYLGEQLDCVGW